MSDAREIAEHFVIHNHDGWKRGRLCHGDDCSVRRAQQAIERACAEARAEEREACAKIAEAVYSCSCDEAYTSRRLTAPDCFRCNVSDDIAAQIRDRAKQGEKKMTMAIEVKNADKGRVAEVRETEFDVASSLPKAAREHVTRLGPGEARTFYIHAAKVLRVSENPNG